MWKRYLGPFATIVGIDIDPACKSLEEEQIHIRIGDQSDPAFLQRVAAEFGPFDIVLDDGSHMMRHISASFHNLYNFVKEGGLYIIEDLHAAYLPEYEGGLKKEGTFIEESKVLLEKLYDRGDEIGKSTYSIDYYDSVIVFQKMNGAMRVTGESPLNWTTQKMRYLSFFLDKYLNQFARYPVVVWRRDLQKGMPMEAMSEAIAPLAFTVRISEEPCEAVGGQASADAFEVGCLFDHDFLEKLTDIYGSPDIVMDCFDSDGHDISSRIQTIYEKIKENGVYIIFLSEFSLDDKPQNIIRMCGDYIDLLNARFNSLDCSFANKTFSISFCYGAIILEKIKWGDNTCRSIRVPPGRKQDRLVKILIRILPRWAVTILKNIRKVFRGY